MKLFLNDKTPVLTEEDVPSRQCLTTCCFYHLLYTPLSCYRSFRKQCREGYYYTLQNKAYDIFKL